MYCFIRSNRLFRVYRAVRDGISLDEIAQSTGYDYWYLAQLQRIAETEKLVAGCAFPINYQQINTHKSEITNILRQAKQMGFADSQIARIQNSSFNLPHSSLSIRELRKELGINPTFQRVDTCAAEFEAQTPYLY